MNERTTKLLLGLLAAVVFILAIVLVFIGQRNIGPTGLLTMLVGLALLVILLWIYNRQYK